MPKFLEIKATPKEYLDRMAFTWHKDGDGEYVVRDKLLIVSEEEAQAYIDASNELYEMYEAGAAYVVEHELFEALDIPPSLVDAIKESWRSERGNHLYGRFDLSGGIDAQPIKLIEFNADTPTLLLETSLIQWMLQEYNGLSARQFNNIYNAIGLKAQSIAQSKKGAFSKMLFSSISGVSEEIATTKLLASMARDRGLLCEFAYLEDVAFREGVVLDGEEREYDFWFKLYPWEEMEEFEGVLHTSVLNPAYTLLYQSKGMLAILSELFPDSPYLLNASFEPLKEKYVKKRMFGREGANIDIVEQGRIVDTTDGIYGEYASVYQEYAEFVRDEKGRYYQAGVFYSDGACGLGFRRGAQILDDMSQFVGHIIQDER